MTPPPSPGGTPERTIVFLSSYKQTPGFSLGKITVRWQRDNECSHVNKLPGASSAQAEDVRPGGPWLCTVPAQRTPPRNLC